MIRSGNGGGGFYLDIRKAQFIPKNIMKHVEAEVSRAVKMMPSQDVLDLAINGADKVRDLDDNRDAALMQAESALNDAQQTLNALRAERDVARKAQGKPLVTG